MSTREELLKIIADAHKQLDLINNKEIKESNKKLVGKCFKIKDRYSNGRPWNIYEKIIGIKDTNLVIVSIQQTSIGNIEIRKMNYMDFYYYKDRDTTEITEKEFQTAWKKIVGKIDKLQEV